MMDHGVVASLLTLALFVAGLALEVHRVAAPPDPSLGPLVVIAVDGLTWPQLNPLIRSGRVPRVAALARRSRARVVHQVGQPPELFWDLATRARTSSLVEPGTARPLELVRLWDALRRRGERVALHDFPGAEAGSAAVSDQRQRLRNALTQLGSKGPDGPTASFISIGGGPRASALTVALLDNFLDELYRRVAPHIVVVVGRGRGLAGTPDDEGLWMADGPGLRAGPMDPGLRVSELSPTLMYLRGHPVPVGSPEGPSRAAIAPAWWDGHPLHWEELP